ncbi:hypothetical protein ACQJBY_007679 [Aegilops geniculata]
MRLRLLRMVATATSSAGSGAAVLQILLGESGRGWRLCFPAFWSFLRSSSCWWSWCCVKGAPDPAAIRPDLVRPCLPEGWCSWWPRLRQLGGSALWWTLCGDGVVAVQGVCGSVEVRAGFGRLREVVHRVYSQRKLCPAMAGRRWRRFWASFPFLKAPSWSSPTRSILGSRSSGESLDPSGSGNDVVSTVFPSLGRFFEDR